MNAAIPALAPDRVLRFAIDPFRGMLDARRRHGDVVQVGYGAQRAVFLFGPEANSFVFANPQLFSWRDSFAVMLPVLGETALLVTDGEEHRRRRPLVLPAFHRRRLEEYARLMAGNTREALTRLRTGERVDLYAELRALIRRNTIDSFFGTRLARQDAEIGRKLQIALDATDLPLGLQLFLTGVPNPVTARAVRSRRWVAERVRAEIAARRRFPVERPDALTVLLDKPSNSGCPLGDDEIEDQVISLIVAGYETTSAAMAWTVHVLLTHPGSWEAARQEVAEMLGDGEADPETLEKMTVVDDVVNEALRLHPPVVVLPRITREDTVFRGLRIRAGTRLAISPFVTHRMPEVWPQPGRFVPGRWRPDHPLHRPATPAGYLPFGGGHHRCVGAPFATLEIKVILIELLRRTRLRSAGPVRPASIMAMRPRRGMPVVVEHCQPEGHA